MTGGVAGKVQNSLVEPALELRPFLRRVPGYPDVGEGFLHDLLRLVPVMHERHCETEGVVLQLHYQGFEPRPIVRFQSALPFRNPTAQRPSGLDVTTDLEQSSLLQFQVAFDEGRAQLASLDIEPQDTALPKLLEARPPSGEKLLGS